MNGYCYHVSLLSSDFYPNQYIVFICSPISNATRRNGSNMVFSSYKEARAKAKELNQQLHQKQIADSEAFLKSIFDTPHEGKEAEP